MQQESKNCQELSRDGNDFENDINRNSNKIEGKKKKKAETMQKKTNNLSATGKMKKHQENEEVGLSFSEGRMEINTASLSPK